MNFRKAVRVTSRWLWFASVFLWIAPGAVEFGLFSIVIWVVWPLRGSDPIRDTAFVLVLLVGISVVFGVAAFRHRLFPLLNSAYRGLAILCSVTTVLVVVGVALYGPGDRSQDSRRPMTLYDVLIELIELAFIVAGVAFTLGSMLRSLRETHRNVPRLIKLLTAGGKNARRKAIVILGEIANMDRGAAREGGAAWVRRMRRWLMASDTPSAMADAVPALQGALRDDDLFVRTQAAKVLKKIER